MFINQNQWGSEQNITKLILKTLFLNLDCHGKACLAYTDEFHLSLYLKHIYSPLYTKSHHSHI